MVTNLVERLRDRARKRFADYNYIISPDILFQSADRIEELELQLAEAREANRKLHRRAQTAEGKLQRMEAAHGEACRIAFTKSIDYHLYAFMLLNCNKSLFPKLVNKGAVVPDDAALIRNQAFEEAAKVAEAHGRHLRRGEGGLEYVNGNLDLAAAIRALSDSTPTLLQEQNANGGKEGE